MADSYVHGVVIKEGTGEIRAIRSPSPYVLGIVGTAPSSRVLAPETPAVFYKKKSALDAVFPSDGKDGRGTLYDAVIGAYEQADATAVLIRAKSGKTEDIISAIEKLADAESMTGFKPKILLVPGFGNTNLQPAPIPPAPAPTPPAPVPPGPAPTPDPDPNPNPLRSARDTIGKSSMKSAEVKNG